MHSKDFIFFCSTTRLEPTRGQTISFNLVPLVALAVEKLVDDFSPSSLNQRCVLAILFVTANTLPATLVVAAAAKFGVIFAFLIHLIVAIIRTGVRFTKYLANQQFFFDAMSSKRRHTADSLMPVLHQILSMLLTTVVHM